ncbi:MAG: iron-containing alcohol dehydrogenase, partial [Chloroflexota bacterium]|nr:iron-containing alcohol dehydrogenase [Chloroflexota bacterium]
ACERRIDAIIALGGGSAIGLAKATSHALEQPAETADTADPLAPPGVPIIAIPTTYAGSEMTAVYGVTRTEEGTARKVAVREPRITPRLVIYDPLLTLSMPPSVTAGTGINAVAHCVEALYSPARNPLATAAALGGLRMLARALPTCVVDGADVAAHCEALAGAWLAGTALAHVTMCLHHGICHVLGGSAGLAHGDANGVMLPHVMRFNLEAVAPLLAPAAVALGGAEPDAAEAVRLVAELTKRLGLPQRLRDLGVAEERLPELARIAFENRTVRNNPKPITSVAQIEELLRTAW